MRINQLLKELASNYIASLEMVGGKDMFHWCMKLMIHKQLTQEASVWAWPSINALSAFKIEFMRYETFIAMKFAKEKSCGEGAEKIRDNNYTNKKLLQTCKK